MVTLLVLDTFNNVLLLPLLLLLLLVSARTAANQSHVGINRFNTACTLTYAIRTYSRWANLSQSVISGSIRC
jgi:hypothetical protein